MRYIIRYIVLWNWEWYEELCSLNIILISVLIRVFTSLFSWCHFLLRVPLVSQISNPKSVESAIPIAIPICSPIPWIFWGVIAGESADIVRCFHRSSTYVCREDFHSHQMENWKIKFNHMDTTAPIGNNAECQENRKWSRLIYFICIVFFCIYSDCICVYCKNAFNSFIYFVNIFYCFSFHHSFISISVRFFRMIERHNNYDIKC